MEIDGSTLVLSNKNHVEIIIIFILQCRVDIVSILCSLVVYVYISV